MKCGHISPITKKSILENQFLRYGFLPFVFLIKEFEEEENYEDCQLLYDIVKEKRQNLMLICRLNLTKKRLNYFSMSLKIHPTKALLPFKTYHTMLTKSDALLQGYKFGQSLRILLDQNNIKYSHLAQAMNSKPEYINKWLNCENIELVNIIAIKHGLQKILKRDVEFRVGANDEIMFEVQ